MPTQAEVLALKRSIRERDGMRCTKCGRTNDEHLAAHDKSLHVHRLTPGGEYTADGCVTLCFACHAPEPKTPRGTSTTSATIRFDDAALVDALDTYARRHRQSRNSAILSLLEQALRESGHYPPKPGDGA